MGNMFSNKKDALVWLVVKGWRQDDNGHWLKGRREAVINPSPANDGVVCVVTKPRRFVRWEDRVRDPLDERDNLGESPDY